MSMDIESDGTPEHNLKSLTILLTKGDYLFIETIKNQTGLSENEIRQVGIIIISSLRGFC